MQTMPHIDVVAQRFAAALRIRCAGCAHSEFIHGDHGARACLYSECTCASFEASPKIDLEGHPEGEPSRRPGPRTRSAAAYAHR